MLKCMICGKPTKAEWMNFCDECLNAPISELQERYMAKERASDTLEDERKPQASEPLKENTRR